MNRRQCLAAWILLLAAAALAAFLARRDDRTWSAAGSTGALRAFPGLKTDDVAAIHVRQPSREFTLRRSGTAWIVDPGQRPADPRLAEAFLTKLWDLRSIQRLEVGTSQIPSLNLSPAAPDHPASGTELRLLRADGSPAAAARFGRPQMKTDMAGPFIGDAYAAGRYFLLPDTLRPVHLANDPLSEIDRPPEVWALPATPPAR